MSRIAADARQSDVIFRCFDRPGLAVVVLGLSSLPETLCDSHPVPLLLHASWSGKREVAGSLALRNSAF